MYCPKCAAQNSEDVKFCRSCGATLELVALALSGKLAKIEETDKDKKAALEMWQKKRGKGMKDLTTGGILLTIPLMLLLVPMLFIGHLFPWLVIWSVFFGWMVIWG